MLLTIFAAVLTIVTSGQKPATDYAAAYKKAESEGKPLVVVVGTDWCQACVSLKHQTIPAMKSSGSLDDVALAMVDRDHQPELAGKLTRGQTIPQIIVYSKEVGGRWSRLQLTGSQSQGTIRSLIDAAKNRASNVLPASHQIVN